MSTTQDWRQREALVCPYLRFRFILGQILGTQKKDLDFSIGFPDLEDRPFGIAETGYSDSQTLTRRRVQSWLSEGHGQVPSLNYLF